MADDQLLPTPGGAQLVDGAAPASPEYWRARAEELALFTETLQALALLLAAELSPEQVARAMSAVASRDVVLRPGTDTTGPTLSDVKTELDRLWTSLLPEVPEG